MYVTTNSAQVWKRMADENRQSAQLFGKISAGLAVLVLATGAYAFSTRAKYNDLCTTIEAKAEKSTTLASRELAKSLTSSFCG